MEAVDVRVRHVRMLASGDSGVRGDRRGEATGEEELEDRLGACCMDEANEATRRRANASPNGEGGLSPGLLIRASPSCPILDLAMTGMDVQSRMP